MMFDEKRRWTSIVLFSSILLTLFVAFALDSLGFFQAILLLICVLIQFGALFWYIIILIPYGRKMVCGCFKALRGSDNE